MSMTHELSFQNADSAQPADAGPKRDGKARALGAKSDGTARSDEANNTWHSLRCRAIKTVYKSVGTAHESEAARVGTACSGKAAKTRPDCMRSGTKGFRPTGLLKSVLQSGFGLVAGSSARAALSLKWAFPQPNSGQTA